MVMAFLTGILLGIVFFGGLYYSVNRMPHMKHPAAFMLLSLFVRLLIVVAGLYLIRGEEYYNLLLALVGIILSRFIITSRVKKKES